MYIFNSFYLLHSYNPSFLICLCFNMVSFRGQKKAWAMPRSVSFRGLIQNFRRASTPFSYVESPNPTPPPQNFTIIDQEKHKTNKFTFGTPWLLDLIFIYVISIKFPSLRRRRPPGEMSLAVWSMESQPKWWYPFQGCFSGLCKQ